MPTTLPSRATAARRRLLVLAVPKRQHVVVLVAGDADRATAPLLRRKLVDSLFYRPRSLLIDARDLTFCDLGGLDALVDFRAIAERSGTHVTLQPSTQLAWLIAIVRQGSRTSGQPDLDPSGCPLPRLSRQTA